MSSRPLLRADVILTRRDRGGRDAWYARVPERRGGFWLDDFEKAVLDHMDGRHGVEDIARAVGATGARAAARARGIVEAFRRLGLLVEGPEPELTQRQLMGQLRAVSYRSVRDRLVGLDHAVGSDCATCVIKCCSFRTTVTIAEGEAIQAAAGALEPPLADLFLPTGDDRTLRLRHHEDNRCSQLEASGGCRLHRLLGPRNKPLVCQSFPTVLVVTPDGPRSVATTRCPHPSVERSPEALAAQQALIDRAAALCEPADMGIRIAPDEVRVRVDVDVPWSDYAGWEAEVLRSDAADAVALATEAARLAVGRWGPPESGGQTDGRDILQAVTRLLVRGGRVTRDKAALLTAPGRPIVAAAPAELVANGIRALEPLRLPTLLAGLGATRLFATLAARDPEAAERPAETFARWSRALAHPMVHRTLLAFPASEVEQLCLMA